LSGIYSKISSVCATDALFANSSLPDVFAICFPVLTSASADGGGIDLRLAKFLYVLPKPALASLLGIVDDRDNVGSFILFSGAVSAVMVSSLNGSGYDLLVSIDEGVNKDSVLVCRDPEKTRCCGFLVGFVASFSKVDTFSGIGERLTTAAAAQHVGSRSFSYWPRTLPIFS
jgi:hypothetical protein